MNVIEAKKTFYWLTEFYGRQYCCSFGKNRWLQIPDAVAVSVGRLKDILKTQRWCL